MLSLKGEVASHTALRCCRNDAATKDVPIMH